MALSLLNTNEVQVVRVVKALYNAAPGNVYLTNFVGYANAFSVSSLATTLAKDFAANDNATLAASVAANLGLTGAALTAGTAYLTAEFGKAGADRGVVILNAVNALSNLTADATYGAAATAFNDSVATGLAYSTNSANTSTDLATLQAAAIPTGNTVAMVAGTDNLTGTTRGDTFTGTLLSTLTDVDRVNGGAGNDLLKATLGAAGTTTPAAITDVETIRVTGSTGAANNVLDVKYATGLTLLEFSDVTTTAGATHTIQGITSPSIGLKVANATATSTTLNFTHAAAGLTGTADTVALTLQDNGSSSALVAAVQVNTAGIEGLTVASNGAGNYITNLTTAGDLKSLTISGSAPLTVTTLGGADSDLTTIDVSAATGGVSIDTSFTSNIKVTGGAGNDSFTFGSALDVNDVVNGGEGTDTVSVSAAVATNVTLTSIETLKLTAGADQDLSQTNLSAITTVSANPGAGDTTALTNATPGKHTLSYTGSAANAAMTYALKSTLNTTADSLTVNVGSAASDGTDRGDFTANDIETLTVNSASKTVTTANTLGLTATSAKLVKLGGTAALTIDATDFASEVTIDASAMAGVLTIGSEASTDQTIIGGAANDAITFASADLNTNDSVDGGAGNDTVTIATNGANTVTYGRVSMANVENLNATFNIDDGGNGADAHSIDLRNAAVATVKATLTGAGAANTNNDTVAVNNIQASVTKVTVDLADEDFAGTVTLASDRNLTGNFVVTGAAGTNLASATIATTGDWQSIAIKQTASASTDAHTLAFSADTGLTSLSVDATEQAMTFSSVTAQKLASLTITGDNAVTVTALSQSTAALAAVDASSSSAAITITASTRTAAATVTTGSGDDAIELTLGTEAGNTINAGTNSTVSSSSTGDTLNLNGTATGSNVIDLSSTTDQVTTINGVANAATQIGFEHVSASGTAVAGGTFFITGSSGINVITGGAGNDTIDGGSGNDTITGGSGVDVLTGGAGNDSFVLSSTAAGNGIDLVTDFQAGTTAGAADVLNATALAAFLNGGTTAIKAITATTTAGAANDNFLTIATSVGTYADAAAMKTALASGGLVTFGSSLAAATAHVLIAYTSSVTGNVRIAEAVIADAGGIDSASDLVELVGVTAYTSFNAANFVMD